MPIAGALVVPVNDRAGTGLQTKLADLPGVEVEQAGPNGIAIVLEAGSSGELKGISQAIEKWDDVLEFELAYFNWEDEIEEQVTRT